MSEWHDMQKELNTKVRNLLKSKQAKTRKPNGLSKTEKIGWQSFMGYLMNLDVEKTHKIVGRRHG